VRPAGTVSLGLDPERRQKLRLALTERELTPMRRRRGVRWALPDIEVLADSHGRPGGPVRDAVLREIRLPEQSAGHWPRVVSDALSPNRVPAPAAPMTAVEQPAEV
jgi:hypothetical protein